MVMMVMVVKMTITESITEFHKIRSPVDLLRMSDPSSHEL